MTITFQTGLQSALGIYMALCPHDLGHFVLYRWTSINVSCSQKQESRAGPAPAGVKLHRGLIRKDGKGGWARESTGYGSIFCFRAVSAAASGAKVQTNILQVHKVHTYFFPLAKVHLSVDIRADALVLKSRRRGIMWIFEARCKCRNSKGAHTHSSIWCMKGLEINAE